MKCGEPTLFATARQMILRAKTSSLLFGLTDTWLCLQPKQEA